MGTVLCALFLAAVTLSPDQCIYVILLCSFTVHYVGSGVPVLLTITGSLAQNPNLTLIPALTPLTATLMVTLTSSCGSNGRPWWGATS